MERKGKIKDFLIYIILLIVTCFFIFPILLVIMNSTKGNAYIFTTPFEWPTEVSFIGISNYIRGIEKTSFFASFCYSLFITVGSVLSIMLCCSMAAWIITRVKSWYTTVLYFMFTLGMVVPFQMVMYTMARTANRLGLDNPLGIIVVYTGFGCGLAIFMFSGFVKGIPIELEEAALIDGCNPISTFFRIVFFMLKPIIVTVAILNAMWIWNDYLLPYLVLGSSYRTIPVAIQYLKSGYGSIDYGHLMALIVLSLMMIVVFYFTCQKHIIEGIVAGAIKG
ncbi:MAG: carbohydrate ABC transporter permease [Eubacteriales bacterium]